MILEHRVWECGVEWISGARIGLNSKHLCNWKLNVGFHTSRIFFDQLSNCQHEFFIVVKVRNFVQIRLRSVVMTLVCLTSHLQHYMFCCTNWCPIKLLFFCLVEYDIRKSINLRYNVASHRFQYNFPRSRLFWDFNPLLFLQKTSPQIF